MKIWITSGGRIGSFLSVHREKPTEWLGRACGYYTGNGKLYCRDVFKDLEPLPKPGTKAILEVELKAVR